MKAAEVNQTVDCYPVLECVQQTHKNKMEPWICGWQETVRAWKGQTQCSNKVTRLHDNLSNFMTHFIAVLFLSPWLPLTDYDTRRMFLLKFNKKDCFFFLYLCFHCWLITISHRHPKENREQLWSLYEILESEDCIDRLPCRKAGGQMTNAYGKQSLSAFLSGVNISNSGGLTYGVRAQIERFVVER